MKVNTFAGSMLFPTSSFSMNSRSIFFSSRISSFVTGSSNFKGRPSLYLHFILFDSSMILSYANSALTKTAASAIVKNASLNLSY